MVDALVQVQELFNGNNLIIITSVIKGTFGTCYNSIFNLDEVTLYQKCFRYIHNLIILTKHIHVPDLVVSPQEPSAAVRSDSFNDNGSDASDRVHCYHVFCR
jgi:hypothetical protein